MTKIMPVIMSGGAGSRLWPLSRAVEPKQLLPLVTNKTMAQETVLRLIGEIFLPPVFICNASHATAIQAQMAEIGQEIGEIIVEPTGRNTAPCAVAAALHAATHAEPPLVLLMPADHHVKKPEAFCDAIHNAVPAARSGHLVTFGITPDAPETGYGYIQAGEAIDSHARHVKAFREKPSLETAQQYLAEGGYAWNGGIFLFAPQTLISEMQAHAPDIYAGAEAAFAARYSETGITHLGREAFMACPAQSIDYAVMEPTQKAAIVPADIGWTDIGSFAALHDELKAEGGNALSGDILTHATTDCLIHTDGPLVATVGVEGLSVIVKDGAVLVARLDAAQDVKQIVTQLKSANRMDDL